MGDAARSNRPAWTLKLRNKPRILAVLRDPVWERQPREPRAGWAGFQIFRDLGPERTLERLARDTHVTYATTRYRATGWRWVERAKRYDEHVEALRLAQHTQSIVEMNERHATAAQQISEALSVPAKALGRRLARMTPERAIEELSYRPTHELVELLAKVSRPFADLMRVERVARGEPADVPSQNRGGGAVDDLADAMGRDPEAMRHLHEAMLLGSRAQVVDVTPVAPERGLPAPAPEPKGDAGETKSVAGETPAPRGPLAPPDGETDGAA